MEKKPFKAVKQDICCICKQPVEVNQYIVDWYKRPKHYDCKNVNWMPSDPSQVGTPVQLREIEPKQTAPQVPAQDGNSLFNVNGLINIIKPHIEKAMGEYKVDMGQIKGLIEDAVKTSTKTFIVKQPEKNVSVKLENVHEKFELLLKIVCTINPTTTKRFNVYTYGEAGSGKSTMGKQIADALKLNFWFTSVTKTSVESKFFGYMDASGKYVQTTFYEWYTKGGVYCIDEMDNASPQLMVSLNTMLENGHGAFPCGMVERHPDAILICSGNTDGRGGNIRYPERIQFSESFRGRFVFVHVDYDEKLEEKIASSITKEYKPALEFLRNVRSYVKRNNIRLIVSPRETYMILTALENKTFSSNSEAVECLLFKGLNIEEKDRILSSCGMF